MKKFFSFIAEYFRFLVTGWWPPCLWAEIKFLRTQVDSLHVALAERAQPDEQTARAMLCQLRVHQESVRHRTGYMVSAFVPNGVVEQLITMGALRQKQFESVVAEALVANAMSGIYKRSQATNKLTALIFEPLTKSGQNVKLVGGFFETDRGPEFSPMIPDNEKPNMAPLLVGPGVVARPERED